ncbi:MAG: DMT family transporter [Bacteriovoracaceae bacterium]|nr:DMT family transporter [Bacteriovoracaceae bacterium]
MKQSLYGTVLCIIVTTIFSFHYIAAKHILASSVSPFALSAWRGLVGGGLILFYFRKKFTSKDIFKGNVVSICLMAFLGFFINQIFFMKGLKLTTPLNTAIISNTIPIVTLLFAGLLGIEKVTTKKVVGIGATFLLVSYLIISGNGNETVYFFNLGNLLILLNVMAFCLAFVLGKKVLKNNFPFELLTGLMLFGGGFLMVFIANKHMVDIYNFASGSLNNTLLVLFEIIISTSIVYLLNLKALQLMNATKVAFFIYLQPIITGISDFFIRGSIPQTELFFIFPGILVIGFLVVSQKSE